MSEKRGLLSRIFFVDPDKEKNTAAPTPQSTPPTPQPTPQPVAEPPPTPKPAPQPDTSSAPKQFCNKCGVKNEKMGKFCSGCGNEL